MKYQLRRMVLVNQALHGVGAGSKHARDLLA